MKLHAALFKTAMGAAWFFIPFVAFSQNQQLSLKRGFYARETFQCKDAPNAAIRIWDGVGFSGAHSSKCTSRLLSQHGTQFRISTTCSALGDGKPDTSGYVEDFSLTRLSSTRFVILKEGQPEAAYRWCGPKATN